MMDQERLEEYTVVYSSQGNIEVQHLRCSKQAGLVAQWGTQIFMGMYMSVIMQFIEQHEKTWHSSQPTT